MSFKPAAFLSYAHRDDDYHGGAITKLRVELSGAISVAIGDDFEIFQDRKDIKWGEHWPSKLEQGLTGGRFLIAILSPSFFNSDYCRKELAEFLEIERQAKRNDLILPIYYVKTPLSENQAKRDGDPLAKAIAQRQYADWRDLRHLPLTDPKVRRRLDGLAEQLVQALERSENLEPAAAEDRDEGPFLEKFPILSTSPAEGEVLERENRVEVAEPVQRLPDPGFQPRVTLSEPGTVFRDVDEPWCPEMVAIRAGTFRMGSPPGEDGRDGDEGPQHRVRIAKPFALGRYPVTFEEYDHFTEVTGRERVSDRGWGRGRRPVINVDVEDAEDYLAWLSELTGRTYRLPSEAEWEYACRAQSTTPFWTGETISTDQANYDGNLPYGAGKKGQYREQTTEVGSFPANPYGLFDMHGNVWEWCADRWHDDYEGAPSDGSARLDGKNTQRVLRGGSWVDSARLLRSAGRDAITPDDRSVEIGFRCARVQEES